MVDNGIWIAAVSGGVSLVSALVAMRSGLHAIEKSFNEFRAEINKKLEKIDRQRDAHNGSIHDLDRRVSLAEREILFWASKVAKLTGEDLRGFRGKAEGKEDDPQ